MESDIFYLFNCINHINNLKFRYANQNFLYLCTTFEKVLFWEAKFFTNSILVQLLSSISVFLCALLCGTSFNSTFRVHSYCDVNTRYSNSYRKHSKDIPQFLRNRPKDLVKYGLQKMTLAANIDTSVIKNTGGGHFAVLSFSDNQKEIYELSFDDTLSMPQCSCIDWSITGYP